LQINRPTLEDEMTSSSTTSMANGPQTMAQRNSPQPPEQMTPKAAVSHGGVVTSGQDARQGKRGKPVLYVLVAAILLLLIGYALIGLFSDTLLVSDVAAPVADEAAVPGPTEAQETIITERQ
jgi:hypothetical protein